MPDAKERASKRDEAPRLTPEASMLLARAAADGSAFEDVEGTIARLIEEIDATLTRQVNVILHAPTFRRLEAAWRGLHHLVRNTPTGAGLKIRVLDVSLDELRRHLGATDWKRTALFRRLHDDTFGMPGGEPYACLVGDFEFAHEADHLQVLRAMAAIAASIQAPFITNASTRLFGVESWDAGDDARVSSEHFDGADHAGWRALRDDEDARCLALCLPRLLGRARYGDRDDPVPDFAFEEDVSPSSNAPWIGAAYAMAANIGRAQAEYGWCTRFRGIASGGEIVPLPVWSFPTGDGGPPERTNIEVAFSEKAENRLGRAGLNVVLTRKGSDRACYVDARSMFHPRRFAGEDAVMKTAADAISARLPSMLPVWRFAHYLRVLIRDSAGRCDPASLAVELQGWLDGYVNDDLLHASEAAQALRPLAAGRVDVIADEERPDGLDVRLSLQPNYQLEGLDVGTTLLMRL